MSICAELLAGVLETCGCRVADGIASRGTPCFSLDIIGCILCRSSYLGYIRVKN